jgi:hypothetical protein
VIHSELCFTGIPLLAIAVPALLTTIRHRDRYVSRFQMFSVCLAGYSLLVSACGMGATILVDARYASIPGTASDGGMINGDFYFNSHDQQYTQVPRETWERAWFMEQLSQHLLWVPFGVFGASVAFLYFTRRLFPRAAAADSVESNRGTDSHL